MPASLARGVTVDGVQPKVAIRPATSADITAILGLWIANGAVIEDGGVDMLTPYLAHLLLTGRVLVAVDDVRVAGFGAVVERGGVTHLADLFVDPHRFEQGIGGRLLAPLFGDAVQRTTFASSDPRALPLYVRNGMTPLWPNLYLDVDSSRLPPASPGLACEPAGPETLATLEHSWLGLANADDHRFWASMPTARPFVVLDAGEAVAAVHTRCRRTGTDRWINRLVLAPGVDPAPTIVAAWRHAAEGGRIGCCLPGPSPALPVLLEAGSRIVDRDTFMTSDPSLYDPTRRVTDGGII
jgi:GNAT superfamily N-acetyltransferase